MIARLRAERRRAKLSQRALARRVGRPQSYVSKAETGERRLDLIETLTLCEAIGVALDDIVPQDLRPLLRGDKNE